MTKYSGGKFVSCRVYKKNGGAGARARELKARCSGFEGSALGSEFAPTLYMSSEDLDRGSGIGLESELNLRECFASSLFSEVLIKNRLSFIVN